MGVSDKEFIVKLNIQQGILFKLKVFVGDQLGIPSFEATKDAQMKDVVKREALTFPDVKKNGIFNYAELDPERLNIEESTTN